MFMTKRQNMKNGYRIAEENLSHLKEGDILLMRPDCDYMWYKYPVAWIILFATKSTWSHAAIYDGDNLVLESTGAGVSINNMMLTERYIKDYRFIALRFKDSKKQEQFIKVARSKVGRKYDFIQAFFTGLSDILYDSFKARDIRLSDSSFDTNNRYFCSELVSDSLFESGINIQNFARVNRSKTLPDDLLMLTDILEVVDIPIQKFRFSR